MKKGLNTALIVLLCGVFVFSVVRLVGVQMAYRQGENIYNEAAQEFVSELPPSPAQQGQEGTENQPAGEGAEQPATGSGGIAVIKSVDDVVVDFAALKQVNSEVIGWLIIENTTISYPLMQGEDNDKYLHTTYNGKSNKQGSIFLDCYCSSDFSSPNSIIYGHNMRNNSMFGNLSQFAQQNYYDNHRYFYILTETGRLKYAIFASYTADITSGTYKRKFVSEEDFAIFIASVKELSQISTGVEVDVSDKIVTLSTCTATSSDTHRFVVQGKLVEDSRII